MAEGEQPDLYYQSAGRVVQWCDQNTLILNPVKTEEVIFGNINSASAPVSFHNKPIIQSSSFKYLGVHIDSAPFLDPPMWSISFCHWGDVIGCQTARKISSSSHLFLIPFLC